MPTRDVLESQSILQDTLVLQPLAITDSSFNLIKDNDLAFLLRVLIQEVHGVHVLLERILDTE